MDTLEKQVPEPAFEASEKPTGGQTSPARGPYRKPEPKLYGDIRPSLINSPPPPPSGF